MKGNLPKYVAILCAFGVAAGSLGAFAATAITGSGTAFSFSKEVSGTTSTFKLTKKVSIIQKGDSFDVIVDGRSATGGLLAIEEIMSKVAQEAGTVAGDEYFFMVSKGDSIVDEESGLTSFMGISDTLKSSLVTENVGDLKLEFLVSDALMSKTIIGAIDIEFSIEETVKSAASSVKPKEESQEDLGETDVATKEDKDAEGEEQGETQDVEEDLVNEATEEGDADDNSEVPPANDEVEANEYEAAPAPVQDAPPAERNYPVTPVTGENDLTGYALIVTIGLTAFVVRKRFVNN